MLIMVTSVLCSITKSIVLIVGVAQLTTLPATQPAPVMLKTQGARELAFRALERLISGNPGDVSLKGNIKGADDQPLGDIAIEVTQSFDASFGPAFYKPPQISTYRSDSGGFLLKLDLQKHIGAEIAVHRDGYYDRRIYISGGPDRDERDSSLDNAMARDYVGYDPSGEKGLTIHLQKKGQLTVLKALFPAEVTVRIDRDGNLIGADPQRGTPQVEIDGDKADSPKPGIFCLKAAHDHNGFSLARREELTYIRPAHDVPLGLQFTANDPTIQIQWADPADPSCPALSLTEAPSAGYAPSLDITPDRFDAYWSNPEEWFYCRIGNEYGRGRISDLDLSRDEREIRVRFQIWLQPDGSRNLETGQER